MTHSLRKDGPEAVRAGAFQTGARMLACQSGRALLLWPTASPVRGRLLGTSPVPWAVSAVTSAWSRQLGSAHVRNRLGHVRGRKIVSSEEDGQIVLHSSSALDWPPQVARGFQMSRSLREPAKLGVKCHLGWSVPFHPRGLLLMPGTELGTPEKILQRRFPRTPAASSQACFFSFHPFSISFPQAVVAAGRDVQVDCQVPHTHHGLITTS